MGAGVRPTMQAWSRGRCTLLGDACHPMVPFLAQGAVMTLEDGMVLARCLEKYPHDHPTAFARYEAARRRRANKVVAASADMIPAPAQPGTWRRRDSASPRRAGIFRRKTCASATTGCIPTTRSRSRFNGRNVRLSAYGCEISSRLRLCVSSIMSPVFPHEVGDVDRRRAGRYIAQSSMSPGAHASQRLAGPQDAEAGISARGGRAFFRSWQGRKCRPASLSYR